MGKSKIQEETSTELRRPAFIDLYNLHLQAGIVYKEVPKDILRNEDEPVYAKIGDVYYPIPPEELTPPGECQDWESLTLYTKEIKMPTEEEKQRIINFFKNHAPHVTKYLTFYEQENGIPWFENNDDFLPFMNEYQNIQKLVDGYLEDSIEPNLISWLKERIQESKQTLHFKKVESQEFVNPMEIEEQTISLKKYQILYEGSTTSGSRFGLGLGVLFFQIYTTLARMLEGEVKIDKCKRNDCNNIFLKSGKRKYCRECSSKAKLENDRKEVRKEAAKVYKTLCDWIDKWLKQDSRGITATELKEELKKIAEGSYKPGSIETQFLGGITAKSLGRLLPQVEEKLKEKGILIEIKKRKKGYLYRFTRIQA
jgi:hypothetical protein